MIQLPLFGIGRSIKGGLALGLVDSPSDFLDNKTVIWGIVLDVYSVQDTIDRIEKQMQAVSNCKAPVAVKNDFAVTYQEAEEVLYFLRDPVGYNDKARGYFAD